MPKHGGENPNDKPSDFNLAVKKLMHYLNKYKFRIIFALILRNCIQFLEDQHTCGYYIYNS